MANYSVMVPGNGDRKQLPELVLVRDGFHFLAAVFGPFWLLYHRNWRGFAGWLTYAAIVAGLFAAGFLRPEGALWALEAAALFIGLQGQFLLEAVLRRRRFKLLDIVSGSNAREAERIYFRRALASEPAKPTSNVAGSTRAPIDSVIGLFPMSETRP